MDLQDAPLLEATKPRVFTGTDEEAVRYNTFVDIQAQEEERKKIEAERSLIDSTENARNLLHSGDVASQMEFQGTSLESDAQVSLSEPTPTDRFLLNPSISSSPKTFPEAEKRDYLYNKYSDLISFQDDGSVRFADPPKLSDVLSNSEIESNPAAARRKTVDYANRFLEYGALSGRLADYDKAREQVVDLVSKNLRKIDSVQRYKRDGVPLQSPLGGSPGFFSTRPRGEDLVVTVHTYEDGTDTELVIPGGANDKNIASMIESSSKAATAIAINSEATAKAPYSDRDTSRGLREFDEAIADLSAKYGQIERFTKKDYDSSLGQGTGSQEQKSAALYKLIVDNLPENLKGDNNYGFSFAGSLYSGLIDLWSGLQWASSMMSPNPQFTLPDGGVITFQDITNKQIEDRSSVAMEMRRLSSSTNLDPSTSEQILSAVSSSLGTMAPTIVASTLVPKSAPILARNLLALSPMASEVFGRSLGERLNNASDMERMAAGESDITKKNELLSEAARLRDTAYAYSILETAKEVGTELIFSGDMLLASALKGGVKGSAAKLVRSAYQNTVEELTAETLGPVVDIAIGDKVRGTNFTVAGGAGTLTGMLFGVPSVAYSATKAVSEMKSGDTMNFEFGERSTKADAEGIASNLRNEIATTPEIPQSVPVGATTIDSNGTEFTRSESGWVSPSGNTVVVFSDVGKGKSLDDSYMSSVVADSVNSAKQGSSTADYSPDQGDAPATSFDDELDRAIGAEFHTYDKSNDGHAKSRANLVKAASPFAPVWDSLKAAGYRIRVIAGGGQVTSGGMYVDRDNKSIVLNLNDLSATAGAKTKGWYKAAALEELMHVAAGFTGDDYSRIANTAGPEVVDAAEKLSGYKFDSPAQAGEEILMMMAGGRMTTDGDGNIIVGSAKITASKYRGFNALMRDNLATLFSQFNSAASDKDNVFHTEASAMYERLNDSFKNLFGVSIHGHNYAKQLASRSLLYPAKSYLYKLAARIPSLPDFISGVAKEIGKPINSASKRILEQIHTYANAIADFARSLFGRLFSGKTSEQILASLAKIAPPARLAKYGNALNALLASVSGFQGVDSAAFNEVYGEISNRLDSAGVGNIVMYSQKRPGYPEELKEAIDFSKRLLPLSKYKFAFDKSELPRLVSKGSIVFSITGLDEDLSNRLRKMGVRVITPRFRVDSAGISQKEWEQNVLGRNGISTVDIADLIANHPIVDALANDEAFMSSSNSKKRKLLNEAFSTDEAQADLRKLIGERIPEGTELFFKPSGGSNSQGISELNVSGEKIKIYFKGNSVVAQQKLDLDHSKSFRVHALNVDGKFYIVPAATYNRPTEGIGYFPVIAGPMLEEAMKAEESALNALNESTRKEELDGMLLSLDLEYDNSSGKYYIIEFNPSGKKGGGGYARILFTLDSIASMLGNSIPMIMDVASKISSQTPSTTQSSQTAILKSSPPPQIRIRRSKKQIAAASRTSRDKALSSLISSIHDGFVLDSDRAAFEYILSDKNVDIVSAITKLREIKASSDARWFSVLSARFPEVIRNRKFDEFDNDIDKVRAEIRHFNTNEAEASKIGEGPSDPANIAGVASLIRDIPNVVYNNGEFMDAINEVPVEERDSVISSIRRLVSLDLKKLNKRELSRVKAMASSIVESGDLFGLHDLMSYFEAKEIVDYVGKASGGNPMFSNPLASINIPISKMQSRVRSVFRYSWARKLWDKFYGRDSYIGNVSKFRATSNQEEKVISSRLESLSLDQRIRVGIASILTQFDPTIDETKEFNKRLGEIRASIKALSKSPSKVHNVVGEISENLFKAFSTAIGGSLEASNLTGENGRLLIEAALAPEELSVLEYARSVFASKKSEAKYIKRVIFGEQFREVENYVHLIPKSTSEPVGFKGSYTRSLGTQEDALKDRSGLPDNGNSFYELDIATMLIDGIRDHTYEFSTAKNRLMLSHLHNRTANNPVAGKYKDMFSNHSPTSRKRWGEVTSILEEIHHGSTSAAYSINGAWGKLFNATENLATVVNGLALINPANAPAQFLSGVAGLSIAASSGKIKPKALGLATLLQATHPLAVSVMVDSMSPGIKFRGKNPDSNYKIASAGSDSAKAHLSSAHTSAVRNMAAKLELYLRKTARFATDNVLGGLIRVINGKPDEAIARLAFISAYLDSYINTVGDIKSMKEVVAAMSNIHWPSVSDANDFVDSIMGNPSSPEMKARTFQSKTIVHSVLSKGPLLFRQTAIGLSTNSWVALKTALGKGGKLDAGDMRVRFEALAESLQAATQFVVFNGIKYKVFPVLVSYYIYSLIASDDDDLNDRQKAAKRDLENLYLDTERLRFKKQRVDPFDMFSEQSLAQRTQRNNVITLIQSFIPSINNEVGDSVLSYIFDKTYSGEANKFWIQAKAITTKQLADIERQILAYKLDGLSPTDELKRKEHALKVVLSFVSDEVANDSKLLQYDSTFGGSYSNLLEAATAIAEISADKEFSDSIRDLLLSRVAAMRPAYRVRRKADRVIRSMKYEIEKKKDKAQLIKEALAK